MDRFDRSSRRIYMADYGFVCVSTLPTRRLIVGLLVLLLAPSVFAQTVPARAASAENKLLAEGWAALAQGDLQQAMARAEQAVAEFPRSAAAVAFAVEVGVRRGGALAGLEPYERWLGERRVDEPYALRRVAHAHLESAAANQQHPARLEARTALAADGGVDARAELARAAANGGVAERQLLASLGDSRAVGDLVTELRAPGGSKVRVINALVESRSRAAIPPLVDMLNDPREEHRAAAAEALGKLGAVDTAQRIKPLLNDPTFPVRVAAASALYRLEDYDGVQLLNELMGSEHGPVRLAAVEALSVRPPGNWLGVVRDLTRHEEAIVQLGAARLIAPYEPDVASEVLVRLSRSDNPAVREEAGRTFVQRLAADFGTLRKFLRSPDALTSVRAAARILELTR